MLPVLVPRDLHLGRPDRDSRDPDQGNDEEKEQHDDERRPVSVPNTPGRNAGGPGGLKSMGMDG